MSFMGLMDFASSNNKNANNYLTLRIGIDDGVNVIPDMEVNLTKLNKTSNTTQTHFFNTGYGGITFKVVAFIKYATARSGSVKNIIHEKTDMWNNRPVKDVLHDWFINMVPLSVVTDAVDIPDGTYIITKNPSRKQNKQGLTVWELEFTTYTPLNLFRYKNTNTNVLNALKKNKAKHTNSSKKKKKNEKLAKCNYKTLKYSKKKKIIKCVKYMQQVLYKKKYLTKKQVDGWFGKETTKAVKRFQKAYNKKHVKTTTISGTVKNGAIVTANKKTGGVTIVKPKGINKILPTNGKVDKATFNALIKA